MLGGAPRAGHLVEALDSHEAAQKEWAAGQAASRPAAPTRAYIGFRVTWWKPSSHMKPRGKKGRLGTAVSRPAGGDQAMRPPGSATCERP